MNSTECPVCKNGLSVLFKTIDYACTREEFTIFKCASCNLLVTGLDPDIQLTNYYNFPEYYSHITKGKGLIAALYDSVKVITLNSKQRLIRKNTINTGTILDIGCGTGDFLKKMKDNGWTVEGTEPNEAANKNAEVRLSQKIYTNLEQINQKYDVITLWHVLEHIPNTSHTFDQILSCLKPSGLLVIAVPNHESFDSKYYGKFWAGLDVPRHLWHFSKESIFKLADQKNINIKDVRPMFFDSYYVSLLSEKYQQGKLSIKGFLRALIIGTVSNLSGLFTKKYSSLIYIIHK